MMEGDSDMSITKTEPSAQEQEVTMKTIAKINGILENYPFNTKPFPRGKPIGMCICLCYENSNQTQSMSIGRINIGHLMTMIAQFAEKIPGSRVSITSHDDKSGDNLDYVA
jgi:hypothetical protein